ncbi:MAG: D-amino-acid transaminase [Robiginitomaculum sp.]|nr:D-amino-acid transaminase [Robiginitomaculum sp.]MDQ7078218.1 D-amino-acid transaminase [Robiginitomaculum sp.]
MSRVAYVNGAYVPHHQACIHIEDRGYQFSDGVYEVWAVRQGKMLDSAGHFRRLKRSLGELRIAMPMSVGALGVVLREIMRKNRVRNGLIYLQITRGVAPRDHAFPKDTFPSIVITAKSTNPAKADQTAKNGVAVITVPDERWARCDIKTVSLLPNILAKQAAHEKGAFEAWMVDAHGQITEGSSSNAWIITRDGVLTTRNLSSDILGGITRAHVLTLAAERQMKVEERSFSLEEAQSAQEAFMTSATTLVTPITHIDGVAVGEGKPGSMARALRKDYLQSAAT